jgi:hypothetical protein
MSKRVAEHEAILDMIREATEILKNHKPEAKISYEARVEAAATVRVLAKLIDRTKFGKEHRDELSIRLLELGSSCGYGNAPRILGSVSARLMDESE